MRDIWRETAIATAVLAALVEYLVVIRAWFRRWGATDAEAARRFPGDHLVAGARLSSTRAITIAAPPREVWSWLAPLATKLRVAAVDSPRALVLHPRCSRQLGGVVDSSRSFVLEEPEPGTTRLLVRSRAAFRGGRLAAFAWRALLEPAAFFRERRLLVSFRRRATTRPPHALLSG